MTIELLNLVPACFRTSSILTEFLRVCQDRLTDTDVSLLQPLRAEAAISASDEYITFKSEFSLPPDTAFPTDILVWQEGVPSVSGFEIMRVTGQIGPRSFAVTRGVQSTQARTFEAGAYIVVYAPISVAEIVDKIAGISTFFNPRSVPEEYLQDLASLLGATLQSPDYASAFERRDDLIATVDWYKIKGTYQSIQVISFITGLQFRLFDMYTNDYTNFVVQDWFVSKGSQNPEGLDQTYYKSPHFGLFAWLKKVHPAGTYFEGELGEHLWRPSLWGIPGVPESSVDYYVEKTRPVNTVPHYGLFLECLTDQSHLPFTVFDENGVPAISSVTTSDWWFGNLLFDGDSGEGGIFDENPAHLFDAGIKTFLDSVDTWKIGTSGKFLMWPGTVATIDTVRGTGLIEKYKIFDDRIEFDLTIPKELVLTTDPTGITELGLYQSSTDNLVALSTFKAIYKNEDFNVYCRFIVYRTVDPNAYIPVLEEAETLPDTITVDVHCVETCS